MFSAWMLMLAAGNLGILLDRPKLFVSYWFMLPIGILIDHILMRRTLQNTKSTKTRDDLARLLSKGKR